MIAKPIIKLIDEAIIPALLLVTAKMVGILIAIIFYQLPFEVEYYSFLLVAPSIKFYALQSYILAENFSNIAMFSIAALGSAIVVARLHFLHDSHTHPKIHSKLAVLNLEKLILPGYHLYHQAVIWLGYLWLCVGFLVLSTLSKITYSYLALVALIITINLTWIFAKDIEKEAEIKRYN